MGIKCLLVRMGRNKRKPTMATNNRGYWPHTVYPGDILVDHRGHMRKVLHSSQGASGYTINVTFRKKRKSGTGRPTTSYSYTDLKYQGYRPLPNVKVPITKAEATAVMKLFPATNR